MARTDEELHAAAMLLGEAWSYSPIMHAFVFVWDRRSADGDAYYDPDTMRRLTDDEAIERANKEWNLAMQTMAPALAASLTPGGKK